ncbi:hypothetical protein BKA56DRAFT_599682 [Ilyonectria sp. MPI-CAGE-AT-0026]|nr:hypothetical protein BKA56DRAFT_599682 [Ilyonectria sp. MPI-CAGE-AT-0026]
MAPGSGWLGLVGVVGHLGWASPSVPQALWVVGRFPARRLSLQSGAELPSARLGFSTAACRAYCVKNQNFLLRAQIVCSV